MLVTALARSNYPLHATNVHADIALSPPRRMEKKEKKEREKRKIIRFILREGEFLLFLPPLLSSRIEKVQQAKLNCLTVHWFTHCPVYCEDWAVYTDFICSVKEREKKKERTVNEWKKADCNVKHAGGYCVHNFVPVSLSPSSHRQPFCARVLMQRAPSFKKHTAEDSEMKFSCARSKKSLSLSHESSETLLFVTREMIE